MPALESELETMVDVLKCLGFGNFEELFRSPMLFKRVRWTERKGGNDWLFMVMEGRKERPGRRDLGVGFVAEIW